MNKRNFELGNLPVFMTIRETAKTGMISEHHLRLMGKQGRLPGVRVGNRFKVNVQQLVEQLNRESLKTLKMEVTDMAKDKFTVRPQIEVNLTQQDIDDIMVTALEGGICHWCQKAEAVGEYLGEYASDQISRGGALILHDAESAQTWELTLEKFLNGVKLYFEQGCHVQVEDNTIDAGDIDANDADCIIQFAVFGEVVFG